jgi:HPt (histidine-containing phosphotransfer) domain-containing protein
MTSFSQQAPQEKASGADGPLDLDHLARQTLGDGALEREILSLFRRQANLMMRRLSEARAGEDVRVTAHTLKGSARAIGAWRVAAAAEAVEAAGVTRDLSRLTGAVAEANASIEAMLAA